jgi:hypothetical protein
MRFRLDTSFDERIDALLRSPGSRRISADEP